MAKKRRKFVVGKYDKRSGKIGFHDWNLEAVEELDGILDKVFHKALREGFEIATKEYQCRAWFPIEWGNTDGTDGPVPADPTTIYVELPIGEDDDFVPRWQFKLSDLVDEFTELHVLYSGKLDGEGRAIGKKLAKGFRDLAARIEEFF